MVQSSIEEFVPSSNSRHRADTNPSLPLTMRPEQSQTRNLPRPSPEAAAKAAAKKAKAQKAAHKAFMKFRASTPFMLGAQPARWKN